MQKRGWKDRVPCMLTNCLQGTQTEWGKDQGKDQAEWVHAKARRLPKAFENQLLFRPWDGKVHCLAFHHRSNLGKCWY